MAGFVWGVILLATGPELALAAPPCPPQQAREVRIGHQAWRVEVAHTEQEREQGLAGRTGIAPGRAMWFVFPEPGIYGFWMKGMAFALDLAWITPQGRMLGVESLLPCKTEPCPIHYPPEPVAFVLEAAAGSVPAVQDAPASWHCEPD
ncbi:MAG: DUF192 domain-containing protein [Thiobacillus sp.]|nr:DUF192 domain-containing protein [Thiobacillus sp.]